MKKYKKKDKDKEKEREEAVKVEYLCCFQGALKIIMK